MTQDLQDHLSRITTITFDCYGTLIDWRSGIESSMRQVFGSAITHRMHEIYELYLEAEKKVESESYVPYRRIMERTVCEMAKTLGVAVPTDRAGLMGDLLPGWAPFFDTRDALKRLSQGYRLGILSNIEKDLFAETAKSLGVEFDFVITAEDVGSYKPATGHFDRLLRDHAPAEEVLHVAQSLHHDGVPCRDLGLAYVWINRYNDDNDTDVTPMAVFPDLKSLAGVVERPRSKVEDQ